MRNTLGITDERLVAATGSRRACVRSAAGSGTTGAAVVMEGARFLGIERDADYVAIARARIRHWARHTQESRCDSTGRQPSR